MNALMYELAIEREARAIASATGVSIVPLEAFAAVDEDGAEPLVGTTTDVLIPAGGDAMFYGDGGAGKTTLSIDLAFHLAAGDNWLGMHIARPSKVLMIEGEGPRTLLRLKLRRKLNGWYGNPPEGRIQVLETPWAEFTFADEEARARLAAVIDAHAIEAVIAGPLTRQGMDSVGSLVDVTGFMRSVEDLRRRCGRPLTVVLVHHENKGGTVSGAWEGAVDTLLHVQGGGHGHTVLRIQKARWASDLHLKTLRLAWIGDEGFSVDGDGDKRDLGQEVASLLEDGTWRTIKEIAAPAEGGGIGANETEVKELLNASPSRFEMRAGDAARALGRNPKAKLWQLRRSSNALDAEEGAVGGAEGGASTASTLKGRSDSDGTPVADAVTASGLPTQPTQSGAVNQ